MGHDSRRSMLSSRTVCYNCGLTSAWGSLSAIRGSTLFTAVLVYVECGGTVVTTSVCWTNVMALSSSGEDGAASTISPVR